MEVPESITQRTSNPIFRIKNIHPELTEEDLISLFSQVSPVEFIQFDEQKKSVAYGGFEEDHKANIDKAIGSFNGRKAMGKILIVEDPAAPKLSLKDRLGTPNQRDREQYGGRSRFGNRRGGRPNGPGGRYGETDSYRPQKPKPQRQKRVPKSVEDLDKELTDYMNST